LYCQQNNLCFEEYIQFLKDSGGYTMTLDGKAYTILYQIPQDGIIYVPEGQNYYVSGDNTGGYIITAWE
jgi:D-alanyl-D-alanine carboxypeptidase